MNFQNVGEECGNLFYNCLRKKPDDRKKFEDPNAVKKKQQQCHEQSIPLKNLLHSE
jgi:hypothetical protein